MSTVTPSSPAQTRWFSWVIEFSVALICAILFLFPLHKVDPIVLLLIFLLALARIL